MKWSMLMPPVIMLRGIASSLLLLIAMVCASHYAFAQAKLFVTTKRGEMYFYNPATTELHGNSVSVDSAVTVFGSDHKMHLVSAGRFVFDCDHHTMEIIQMMQVDDKTEKPTMLQLAPEPAHISGGSPAQILEDTLCHIT